jgi:TRAP-type mannitol/chloroaromatic compound transport system permease large subunit
MVLIYFRVKLNPELAPRPLRGVTWKERFVSLKDTWGIGVIALIVLGGIYTGVFTPTEAGALGAFGALSLAVMTRRLTWINFKEAVIRGSIPFAIGYVFVIALCVAFPQLITWLPNLMK